MDMKLLLYSEYQNISCLKKHDYLALAKFDFTDKIILRNASRISLHISNAKDDLKSLLNSINTYGLMIEFHNISTTIKALEIDALFVCTNNSNLCVPRTQLINILDYVYKKFGNRIILEYCQKTLPRLELYTVLEKKRALCSILKTLDVLLLPHRESFLYTHSDVYHLLKHQLQLCTFKTLGNTILDDVKCILNYGKTTHIIVVMLCCGSSNLPIPNFEQCYAEIHTIMCIDLASLCLRYSVIDAYEKQDLCKAKELLEDGVKIFVKDAIYSEKDLSFSKLLKELHYSRQVPTLMIFTLIAIRKYSDSEIQKQIFDLVWKTVPDPYVTSEDLNELCRRCEDIDQELGAILSEMPFLYEQYFRKIATAKKSPRELSHLCLCRIRKILQENLNFPSGILQLRLPLPYTRALLLRYDE